MTIISFFNPYVPTGIVYVARWQMICCGSRMYTVFDSSQLTAFDSSLEQGSTVYGVFLF